MERVRIKICGITSEADALAAAEAGADFLGFNFYPKSPRYLEPERVRTIVSALETAGHADVRGVGVFVNEPPEAARDTLSRAGLTIAQLHGDEPPDWVAALQGVTRIKALKANGPRWGDAMRDYEAEYILADAPHAALYGGSGEAYDYGIVAAAAAQRPVFLAGGLHDGNVAQAVRLARPFAVDVASGVEFAPGRKDHAKMRAFCRAVMEQAV